MLSSRDRWTVAFVVLAVVGLALLANARWSTPSPRVVQYCDQDPMPRDCG